MTEKQKEQRRIAYARSYGVCEVCGKPLVMGAMQAAHRIGNTKTWRAKYGSFIIDHPLNVGYVDSLECNAKLDISYKPNEILKLLSDIVVYEINRFQGGEYDNE